jgi:hypothetical protein
MKGYYHHTDSITDSNDLLGGLSSNLEFRYISSCFYSLLHCEDLVLENEQNDWMVVAKLKAKKQTKKVSGG